MSATFYPALLQAIYNIILVFVDMYTLSSMIKLK